MKNCELEIITDVPNIVRIVLLINTRLQKRFLEDRTLVFK